MFPYSYKNTSGSLGEREIEVGTQARQASVSTQFRVLPNFHECFYNIWEHGELKTGNSLLYRSVNYQSCRRLSMLYSIQLYSRNTAFSQSKLAFSNFFFIRRAFWRLSAAHHVTRNPLRPNVIQTWAQKFDYCKMVENVLGDVAKNVSSESENSEASEATNTKTTNYLISLSSFWPRAFRTPFCLKSQFLKGNKGHF